MQCLKPIYCWLPDVSIREKVLGLKSRYKAILQPSTEAEMSAFKTVCEIKLIDKGLPVDLRPLFFRPRDTSHFKEGFLPCGKCLACLLNKRSDWSARCATEFQDYEENSCFLTLTYHDDYLPKIDGVPTLCGDDVSGFIKRLRRRIEPLKIRYFLAGEYGENFSRPHFHVILFGYSFPDKQYFSGEGMHQYFRSQILEELWPYGFSLIGDVTDASIKYVCGYVSKKYNHEQFQDGRVPEFCRMSLKPGIGFPWLKRQGENLFRFLDYNKEVANYERLEFYGVDGFGFPRSLVRRWSQYFPGRDLLRRKILESCLIDCPTYDELERKKTCLELVNFRRMHEKMECLK